MKKIKFLVVTLVLFFCLGMNSVFSADAAGEVTTIYNNEDKKGFTSTILTSGIYFIGEKGSSLTQNNFTGDLDYYAQTPGSWQIDFEGIGKKFNVDWKKDIDSIGDAFEITFGGININDYGYYAIYVHSYAVFYTEQDVKGITILGTPKASLNTDCTIAGNMTHIVDYAHPTSLEEIKSRYHATDNVDGDITNKIIFKTNYNPQSLRSVGVYYIFMSVSDHAGHTTCAADLIWVKDLKAPEIQLSKSEHVLEVHTVFTLEDAKKFFTATDNVTPQAKIEWSYVDNYKNQYNKLGTYSITATAKDSDNNASSKTLTIRVIDSTKPTLSLIAGGDTITSDHVLSDLEIKALIKVSDNYDSLSSSSIQIIENTCTGEQGKEFRIKVSIKDSSNNVGEKTFKYVLTDTEAPIIMVEKTIYIPKGTTYTNEQIIEMLKELGILEPESLEISLNSSTVSIDTEGVYELEYIEVLKDGSKKEGKLKLNVFSSMDEALPTTKKPKTKIWIYIAILLSLLVIPAILVLKKKSYEKN